MVADAARTDGGMGGWPWFQQSQREMAKTLFHAVSAAHRGALVDVHLFLIFLCLVVVVLGEYVI